VPVLGSTIHTYATPKARYSRTFAHTSMAVSSGDKISKHRNGGSMKTSSAGSPWVTQRSGTLVKRPNQVALHLAVRLLRHGTRDNPSFHVLGVVFEGRMQVFFDAHQFCGCHGSSSSDPIRISGQKSLLCNDIQSRQPKASQRDTQGKSMRL